MLESNREPIPNTQPKAPRRASHGVAARRRLVDEDGSQVCVFSCRTGYRSAQYNTVCGKVGSLHAPNNLSFGRTAPTGTINSAL